MGIGQDDKGGFIGAGRPGGPGGNKVVGSAPSDPGRKARPASSETGGSGQHTGAKGSDRDAIRKSRPKSSGSGQSTATGPR